MDKPLKVEVTLNNELGLHARASASFVNCASKFSSDIRIQKEELEINGKSIMGLLMLALPKGSTFEIMAAGADALEAILSLENLVKNKFGEEF